VRKIRFAPGKGNQKLIAMYNDGAEVWDTKEVGPAMQPASEAKKVVSHGNWLCFLLCLKIESPISMSSFFLLENFALRVFLL
jgi:hypothetical protein